MRGTKKEISAGRNLRITRRGKSIREFISFAYKTCHTYLNIFSRRKLSTAFLEKNRAEEVRNHKSSFSVWIFNVHSRLCQSFT